MTDSFDNRPKRYRVSPNDMEVQIRASLIEVQQRLDALLDSIPLKDNDPDAVMGDDDLSDEHIETIHDIRAIEEEWILDPDVREANSAIQFTDDDGDWQWGSDSDHDTFDMGDT